MSRYGAATGKEDEFEPGSDGRVLRNSPGVTERGVAELYESQLLAAAQERFYESFDLEQRFSVEDLLEMHRSWLGDMYPFAGKVRTVDIGKAGFQFASVRFLESNLELFEADFLRVLTPCRAASLASVALAIAKVHGEFIMLHPFRDGNGRLGRWLADAMAAQAGLPLPRYGFTRNDEDRYRRQYLAGVRKAMLADPEELSRFFEEALARGLEGASEGRPR